MKTEFSAAQLADPNIAEADTILRKCVHCGFCTATCPTYVLLGDELDSPRGRIYLIKEMLEKDRPPTAEVVKHIDRCLSCLACMTTCPSGVNYMHLVDQARVKIERNFKRPLLERLLRAVLALVLPRPKLFRASMILARLARPFASLLPSGGASATPGLFRRIKAMLSLSPRGLPEMGPVAGSVFEAKGERRGRVALLQGCAQQVLAPRINQAAISLLTRHGIEVVLVKDEQCCGALTHHMGREEAALEFARANTAPSLACRGRSRRPRRHPGDGLRLRHRHQGDYGFMLRQDRHVISSPLRAAKVSALSGWATLPSMSVGSIFRLRRSVTTTSSSLITPPVRFSTGRKITQLPKELLSGRTAICGERCTREPFVLRFWRGPYNILQPDIANKLRDRKVRQSLRWSSRA